MGMKTANRYPIVTAFVLTVMYSLPLAAEEPVDGLLQQLRTAEPGAAKQIERQLEREWAKSGSVALNMLLERGREALAEEDTEAAIGHLTALTDHAPDFAEGWHARATAYYQAGLYGPALGDLERALALNPENYNAIFGLGVMLEEFGDLRRAEDAFERVLDLNPNHERATEALQRLKRQGIGLDL